MTEVEQKLTSINRDIDQLLHGLGQEGLLDDQFAQLMQLQACFRTYQNLTQDVQIRNLLLSESRHCCDDRHL